MFNQGQESFKQKYTHLLKRSTAGTIIPRHTTTMNISNTISIAILSCFEEQS